MIDMLERLFRKTPKSPDGLPTTKPGVNRVTHVPLIIAGIFLLIVGGIISSTVFAKSKALQMQVKAAEASESPDADKPELLDKHPQSGMLASHSHDAQTTEKPTLKVSPENATPQDVPQSQPPLDPVQEYRFQQWRQREQDRQTLEENRRNILQQALNAPTTIYTAPESQTTLRGQLKTQSIPADETTSAVHFPQTPEPENYLPHTRVPAASPYEIKAGTVIPAVMLGGVNSDLPGQILAQVSQNVYDTATGNYLLIPQGGKLVGTYDHQVIAGQKRILVIWNRLIYPDASSITLAGMPGGDQAGYAGFKDKAASHVWSTFRNALLLSAVTAGVQLSQPRAQKGDYSYSSQQMVAGSLGMQLNQLGISSYQGRINAAPTLTIRPGYQFNVLVNRDIILSPWQSNLAGP